MGEHDLYQKMKAGSRPAFDAIFKSNYEHLVKHAYIRVDSLPIAEDLVQNIFIEFWTKRETLHIKGSVGVYLKKMVHNRCIDYFRKQKSIQRKEEQFFQDSLFLDVSSPEEEMLNKENLAAIYAKIEALPPKCKIVFKLSRFEEMTYAEIANQLDISKKTVELHISTALRILRKTIFVSFILISV